jgi:hypothetical protein
MFESVVRLSALIIGEFGYLVYKKNEEMTLSKQADLLWKHVSICSNKTIYCILNCMIKFVNYDIAIRAYAISQFEQYLESWNTELQQREIECIILSKLDNEDKDIPNINETKRQLSESMPVYSSEFFNNSLLMRKLQQTQTGK